VARQRQSPEPQAASAHRRRGSSHLEAAHPLGLTGPPSHIANLGADDDPEFVAAIAAFTPMGRVVDASEIKGTAQYLASNASSFTNGLMLITDGGRVAA
jgi:NAD(P)-dependent dehydrogenase (short-subunit alcohol dehydrogenase family)